MNDLDLKEAYTPKTLCEFHFKIPIYQRLFVWGEDQILQLLKDLRSAADSPSPRDKYYLGVISVFQDPAGNAEWEVVDGQQRLTFLTLMACEFLHKEGLDDKVRDDWKKFVLDSNEACRIGFQGRSEDREAILAYLKDGSEYESCCANFREFHRVFNEWAQGSLKDVSSFQRFADYCFTGVALLVNELPEGYSRFDLNLYFEKMNSTGVQLTPIELVKGRWFATESARWNACLNFDKRFVEPTSETQGTDSSLKLSDIKSLSIPQDSSKTAAHEERKYHQLVVRPEVLLLHSLALYCKDEESVAKSDYRKLVQTFQDKIGDGKTFDKNMFMKFLCQYRKWIDENIIFLKNDGGQYDYCFRKEAEKNLTDDEIAIDDELRQFQAMLYVSSGENQVWLLKAYMNFREKGETRNLLDVLWEQDRERHTLPDLEKMSYGRVDRYWFWRLDYEIWAELHKMTSPGMNEKLKIDLKGIPDCLPAIKRYVFRRNRSIEHLHPQTPVNQGDEWSSDDENSFGNLAMISTGFNSFQSNKGINEKISNLADQVNGYHLESLKLLLMGLISKKSTDGSVIWDIDMVKQHGVAMYEILERVGFKKSQDVHGTTD